MEKDDEIAGNGNSYTAEFWQYDSRLGRRWNTDPILKPWESPYACFANNPVWFNDVKGDNATEKGDKGDGKGGSKGKGPMVTGNNIDGYTFSDVAVKPSFWTKVGAFFKNLGSNIKDSYLSMANKADDFIHKLGSDIMLWGTGHSQGPGKKAPLPDNPIYVDMEGIIDYLGAIKPNHDEQVTIPYKWPTQGKGKGEDKMKETKSKLYEQDEEGDPVLERVDSVLIENLQYKNTTVDIKVPTVPEADGNTHGLIKRGKDKGKRIPYITNSPIK